MLMDEPGGAEQIHPFINITHHLQNLGIDTPTIYAEDIEEGFLLLEDLGDDTFTNLLSTGSDESMLYQKATDLLIDLHIHPQATSIDLPEYDFAHFIQEARLLTDWYLPASTGNLLSAQAKQEYDQCWRQIFDSLPNLSPTLVLRDLHVDNLMLKQGHCAVLDYQDVLIGSPAYDLVSLLEDARRDLPPSLVQTMKARYLERMPTVDPEKLEHHLVVWGAQRHAKVAGIFVRLWLRDEKPVYLKHLKRVIGLIHRHLNHPCLEPFSNWLAKHIGPLEHRELSAAEGKIREQILNTLGD